MLLSACHLADATPEAVATTGTSEASSGEVDETTSAPQTPCPPNYDAGYADLPPAQVGAQYEVIVGQYSDVGWSSNYAYSVEVPPGLTLEHTSHLHGVPLVSGDFELVIVSPWHAPPRGCTGSSFATLYLRIDEATATGSTDDTGTSESSTGEVGTDTGSGSSTG